MNESAAVHDASNDLLPLSASRWESPREREFAIDWHVLPAKALRALGQAVLSAVASCSVVLGRSDPWLNTISATDTALEPAQERQAGLLLSSRQASRLAEQIEDRIQAEYARCAEAEAVSDALFWEQIQ